MGLQSVIRKFRRLIFPILRKTRSSFVSPGSQVDVTDLDELHTNRPLSKTLPSAQKPIIALPSEHSSQHTNQPDPTYVRYLENSIFQ
jgi:hypothetical protein